jgi:multidrug efflux system membrane fusion protein
VIKLFRQRALHRPGLARLRWVLRLAALALLSFAAGCANESDGASSPGGGRGKGGPGGKGGGGSAFPVEVQPVEIRDVEATITAAGSIEAFEIVQVTARVPGAIERVRFREGERVKKGEVLVEIEPERYRLAVVEAKAAVEKAKAANAEAEAGLARREGANERNPGVIPGEELGTWRTRAATAAAEVAAQEAALHLAERNANDAQARAPFGGIIQTRDVQTGQYVQPGTLLTTLVRRDPLLLRFQVPEGESKTLEPGLIARFRVRDSKDDREAKITYVADTAHPSTRMVIVTAEIPNADPSLRPGAFAEVTVPIQTKRSSPVIPQTAVRPSERGFLAFVVKGDAAEERILTLGMRTADGLVEVRDGLVPGDTLVVRGAEALRSGAKVKISPAQPDSATAQEQATPKAS